MKNSGQWKHSTRRDRLPKNWYSLRKTVLVRDKHLCQLCGFKATEVDHVIPGDDHSLGNLRSLCKKCHAVKSSKEGLSVRQRMKALRKRPSENHPGRRSSG